MIAPGTWRDLIERGDAFDFYQAVRLLELEAPEAARVGRDAFPEQEAVRFRPWLSLASPRSAIESIDPPEGDRRGHRVVVTFFGTYGTHGVLPRHYTQLLLDLEKAGEKGLREFLDAFNHRFVSFYFRANEKYRAAASCRLAGDDPITSMLYSLMGLESQDRRDRSGLLPRRELLRYGGLYTQKPRSVATLHALVTDYFGGLEVSVLQFIGRWAWVGRDDQGCLSDRGANCLGTNVVVGERIWDRTGKFRLRLGPLDMVDYLDFQPDGRKYRLLCSLVREFVGDGLAFDVQPVLVAEEVPALELSSKRWPPPRLGRTTWLQSRLRAAPADDAVFMAPVTGAA